MRTARRTYEGAFHHGMNRGYEGRPILRARSDKVVFLDLLEKTQALTRVRVLAYCLMDNHYHLILQNGSGRMSDFFKQLNGRYAVHYRKAHGGRGYVFQDRYRSTLIQDDAYLRVAIAYVLGNPSRTGRILSFLDYPWSSAGLYFKPGESARVDARWVEELFGSAEELARAVRGLASDELPTIQTELGPVIGDRGFVDRARERAERRSGRESLERRRHRDRYFDPLEKVFAEFEHIHRVVLDEIDLHSYSGKRLRAELLIELKERAGLTYREIARLDLFSDLEISSLGRTYQQALLRRKNEETNSDEP